LADFAKSVFINCPFDNAHAGLLEAMLFCVVSFGLEPRLANERLEAGENRLSKIIGLIQACKFSIHDLSLCRSSTVDETFRMNMPFEYGIDLGFREADEQFRREKRFLVFERNPYDLKAALSDTAGQDVEAHKGEVSTIIEKTRNFFRVELGRNLPGAARLELQYATFQGWMVEKKIAEGHSERSALRLPTRERLDAMKEWVAAGGPSEFVSED
jgi:hypothetical protein